MLSIASRMIPFLEHNDGIRINMVDSQIRQAVALVNGEIPLIRTGYENIYNDYTTFLYKAPKNGKVLFVGNSLFPYMIVKYDDTVDFINLSKKAVESTFDGTLYPAKKHDEAFKKGDVLAHSAHFDDNGNLRLGVNLLSIFLTYEGYNFEDAIVVSESGADKLTINEFHGETLFVPENEVLISLSDEAYIPIRKYGEYVHKNDILFKIAQDKIFTLNDILKENKIVRSSTDGYFYWDLYSNIQKSNYVKYKQFIKEYYKYLLSEEEALKRILLKYFPESKVDEILINKLRSRMKDKLIIDDKSVVGTYIEYTIVSKKPLIVGSKISNRHGNKGVISKILKGNERIFTEYGEEIEVILGPLSPIARMNVGQLFEMQLNRASENFVKHKLFSSSDVKKELITFINMVDNTYNKYYTNSVKQMLDVISKEDFEGLIEDIRRNGLQIIQPAFESITYKQLQKIMEYTKTPELETVILPNGKKVKAIVGKMYFYRLLHEPEKKIISRSVGAYDIRFNQPVGGRRKGGGHRIGEMETWALMAYEAYNFLVEYLNIKSDNTTERMRLLQHLLTNSEKFYRPRTLKTTSFEVFVNLLKGIGIDFKL